MKKHTAFMAAALLVFSYAGARAAGPGDEVARCVVDVLRGLPMTQSVAANGDLIFDNGKSKVTAKLVQYSFKIDADPPYIQSMNIYIFPYSFGEASALYVFPPRPYRKESASILDSDTKDNPLRSAFSEMQRMCKVYYNTGIERMP